MCIYAHTYKCIHMYDMCIYICIICVYAYACIYIYIYTHMHMCMYTHTPGAAETCRALPKPCPPGAASWLGLGPVRLLRVWISEGLTQADS